jgi:hypothetical protein
MLGLLEFHQRLKEMSPIPLNNKRMLAIESSDKQIPQKIIKITATKEF